MRHFQDIFVHCVMCPVIAIACKTFFLVFLKSRWIKWHKHDTSFHQKVVLESPIRTAARSVGERSTSTLVVKRIKGRGDKFYWILNLLSEGFSYCTSLKIGIFAPKKAKNCTCNLKNLPLKMKKGGIFLGGICDHCESIRYHSSFPEKSPKGETWQLKISLFFKATRL